MVMSLESGEKLSHTLPLVLSCGAAVVTFSAKVIMEDLLNDAPTFCKHAHSFGNILQVHWVHTLEPSIKPSPRPQ